MKLLYFSPSSYGGLADYAHAQAEALSGEGFDVTLLCSPDFPVRNSRYHRRPTLPARLRFSAKTRAMRGLRMMLEVLATYRQLAHELKEETFPYVLLGSYAEYFAPIWAPHLKKIKNVRWGAVVHDPVRDTVFGPNWWHRWSISQAYSLLDLAFVHERIEVNTIRACPDLQVHVIPHGPYSFPRAGLSRNEARVRLGLPQNVPIGLIFGHIRDGKNIDLVLEALTQFPEIHLVIAGSEQSGTQRPHTYYQRLAEEFGVANRCHWEIRYIADQEVEQFFVSADYLLLTYSDDFRSASGVLNVACQFQTPCLATSGEGPLRSAVTDYSLGVWRKPNDAAEIQDGLKDLIENPPRPEWSRYERENSWERNARIVKESFLGRPIDIFTKPSILQKAPAVNLPELDERNEKTRYLNQEKV